MQSICSSVYTRPSKNSRNLLVKMTLVRHVYFCNVFCVVFFSLLSENEKLRTTRAGFSMVPMCVCDRDIETECRSIPLCEWFVVCILYSNERRTSCAMRTHLSNSLNRGVGASNVRCMCLGTNKWNELKTAAAEEQQQQQQWSTQIECDCVSAKCANKTPYNGILS